MNFIRSCFNNNAPDAKLLARYISVLLWVIGSLYMINVELAKPLRDWLVILSMPIIWAIVMMLPVIAYQAWLSSRYGSLIALLIASLIGSVLTLSATITRQSTTRDNAIELASDSDVNRVRLRELIAKSELMVAQQTKVKSTKCVSVKYDCNPIDDTLSLIQSALNNHKSELFKLGSPQSPKAGEKRVAQFITDVFGYETHIANKFVADYMASIFGLFLELAAFAVTVYGWHGLGTQEQSPVANSNSISKQTEKIVFLERQLQISNDPLDKRVINKQLAIATSDLINSLNSLNKRG